MFIQTENTPNPAVLKFLPGRELVKSGVREFKTAAEGAAIRDEVVHYTAVRDEVRLGAGENIDFKQYEAGMRFLLDTYIQADASKVLTDFADAGLVQGLCGDGQCFTMLQLQRGLSRVDQLVRVDDILPESLRALSHAVRGRKPSERLFQQLVR